MSYQLPSPTITLTAALHDLGHGSPRARAMAAHALGDVADPQEAARVQAALIIALGDERAEVRVEAAASLGAVGVAPPNHHCIDALVAAIQDEASPVRQAALIALGAIGDARALPAVLAATAHPAPDVRYQAITSLAELDPVAAYDVVVTALADEDGQVHQPAQRTAGAPAGDAIHVVWPCDGGVDVSVRCVWHGVAFRVGNC